MSNKALATIWTGAFELVGIIGPRPKSGEEVMDPKRTARVIRLLLFIGLLIVMTVAVLVIANDKILLTSFVWATIAATCALLSGGLLGILFGLPTGNAVVVRQSSRAVNALSSAPAADAAAAGAIGAEAQAAEAAIIGTLQGRSVFTDSDEDEPGYVESTSLEQIADWLTKIIIGLTLTQYASWEAKYFDLSRSVTSAMGLSGAQCIGNRSAVADCIAAQAIPGGMLMAIFALTGFIVAYFWMRRYFIFEMVTARKEEREKYKKKQERARIDENPVLKAMVQAREDAVKANAEANAAAAKAIAEADAAMAIAAAEAAKAKADAEAAIATAKAEADAAMAKSNSEAQKALASQETLVKASVAITENSPERNAATGENLQQIIQTALTKAPNSDAVKSSLNAVLEEISNTAIQYPDDPWRGRVADCASANGYTLSAVVAITNSPTLFNVKLKVHTDDFERDRGGTVRFLLHPTFGAEARTAAFDANGDAVLDLIAYGVFTVGAITETGTLLELNLAAASTPETAGFLQR